METGMKQSNPIAGGILRKAKANCKSCWGRGYVRYQTPHGATQQVPCPCRYRRSAQREKTGNLASLIFARLRAKADRAKDKKGGGE